MQSEMGDKMIANPIFAASNTEQRSRAIFGVRDDRKSIHVDPDVSTTVFKFQISCPSCHVLANRHQARSQLFPFLIWIEFRL
ncbi:hypothetical protein FrCorBMG51_24205 [Protofrankia coriariae]|uniref:Uncharacterized protein n=1 Tax=Protofrankia coriariae TaxID=1562887 RepID=A0ABR5EYJ2_9ACTN|nr:hypothetical protein FrCorBMG51_24205 [Protofrankia coriariae]